MYKGSDAVLKGLGDGVVILMSVAAFIYGIKMIISKKPPLYFQLIVCSVACYVLGYLFDICEYFVTGVLSGGYLIGYLGTIGCFLFLLTAGFGYMDGIMDDRTANMKNCRYIALAAPVICLMLLVPNLLAEIPIITKIAYLLLWIPAVFSSYFNLKHAIVPDLGFGFVIAIRPFNIAALSFTFLQLIHLTLWNFGSWEILLFSGILLGSSCVVMMVMADRGVKKWAL